MGMQLYRTTRLTDGVWRIDECGLSVMYLIEGDTQALAVDCGVGVGDYLSVIRTLTDKPVIPACTSGLIPCAGGRGQFKTLRIARPDAEDLLPRLSSLRRRVYAAQAKLCRSASVPSLLKMTFPTARREPMTMFLRQGDVIELGGRTVDVIEAPGVTQGCLAFYLREEKLLLTGRAVGRVNNLYRRGGDTPRNLADSADRLAKLDFETALDGRRGDPVDRALLEKVGACAQAAAAKPASRLPLPSVEKRDGVTVVCRADKRA